MTRRSPDDPDPPGGRASKRLEQFQESRQPPGRRPPLPRGACERDEDDGPDSGE